MLGNDPDLDAAERWVDSWQAGIEERAAQAQALARQVSQLSATVRSQGGLVEVTVGPSGVLTGLRLDEGVRRHSAAWIAEQIMATMRLAQAELTDQVRRATAETVGLDSETGRAVVASFTQRLTPTGTTGRGSDQEWRADDHGR